MTNMKKSELKTGMWLKRRNGDLAMVLLNTENGDICSGIETWYPLDHTNEDLTDKYDVQFDIVKIMQPLSNHSYYNYDEHNVIWERGGVAFVKIVQALKAYTTCKGIKSTVTNETYRFNTGIIGMLPEEIDGDWTIIEGSSHFNIKGEKL